MASKRGRGVRHAHKHRQSEPRLPNRLSLKSCDACGKQCYETLREAKRSAKMNHPGQAMHAYECEEPNGLTWWHISSIPASKLKSLRDKRFREN